MPSSAAFVLQKYLIFANTAKVTLCSRYVIINTGQKICGIKFLPMRAGGKIGEIGKNFQLYGVKTVTMVIRLLLLVASKFIAMHADVPSLSLGSMLVR